MKKVFLLIISLCFNSLCFAENYHITAKTYSFENYYGKHKQYEESLGKDYIHIFITDETIKILSLNENGEYNHSEVCDSNEEYQLWNTKIINRYVINDLKQIILTQEQVEILAENKELYLDDYPDGILLEFEKQDYGKCDFLYCNGSHPILGCSYDGIKWIQIAPVEHWTRNECLCKK